MIIIRLLAVFSICMLISPVFAENTQHSSQEPGINMTDIDQDLLDELSEEEQEWYTKFQNGIMLFSGWKEISEEILSFLPPEERPETQHLLETLGIRIGTEWSKDNSERRIDTDQLQAWGDKLRLARDTGAPQLADTVKKISDEVNTILDLDPDDNIASDSP